MFPRWLKSTVRRVPPLVWLYSKVSWRLHLPVSFEEVTQWWQARRSDAGAFNYLFLADGRSPPG